MRPNERSGRVSREDDFLEGHKWPEGLSLGRIHEFKQRRRKAPTRRELDAADDFILARLSEAGLFKAKA